jgi:hypothetical protein
MKITRKQLMRLIRETIDLKPGMEKDPVSLGITRSRATKNKSSAFKILHDVTFEIESEFNNGIANISTGLLKSKRIRTYESYDMEKIASEDPYFKKTIEELDSQNSQHVSASTLILTTGDEEQDEELERAMSESYSKRTLTVKDYFKGVDSNNEFISEYVKNLKGVDSGTAIQSILNVMSCTDFNFEEDNDRWEIAVLIICSLLLGEEFSHTDATSRGVDVTGGIYKMEVKASQKAEPQDNYSNTIPPMDKNKYYFFIATDRCYLIRSDILRRYYLEPVTDEQAIHFAGSADKQYVSDFLLSPEDLFDKLALNVPASDRNFQSFENQAMSDDKISNLHSKIKDDIIDSADALAASIIQTIAGIPDDQRINAPKFGFGGLKIAMRLISRPEKSTGVLTIADTLTDIFAQSQDLDPMERFRLMSIAINKARSEGSDFYSTTDNRREVASQALGLLRQILNDPNGAGKLYALLDQDYDVQVGVSQMEGGDGTTIKNTIKNNLKTLVTSKIKRKYPELNKSKITSEVDKLLKSKFPALYKVPMQEPQDIVETEDDFEFDLSGELKEDRKIQERRRIYELGESHASLLRKKYYGRR